MVQHYDATFHKKYFDSVKLVEHRNAYVMKGQEFSARAYVELASSVTALTWPVVSPVKLARQGASVRSKRCVLLC